MSVLPQFVVVAETLVQHGVALALRHVFELAGLEVSQTDVFHPFLFFSCDSLFSMTQSRSSSFGYQIVVPETENRQLLQFFHFNCLEWCQTGTEEGNLENGPVCRASGRTEMQLLFNGAKDGKPQCTIFAVFEVKKEFWIN
jgi:hypothetical protein